MQWLPQLLNKNVKIIVSTDPEKNQVLKRMKEEVIRNEVSLLELKTLTAQDTQEMFSYFLTRHGRKLTEAQLEVFNELITKIPLPMFVKLFADIATHVTSQDIVQPSDFPITIRQGINMILEMLEKNHGKVLVGRSMSYLVASDTGLSDNEMEDILSLDDDVICSVFNTKHTTLLRLPSLRWLRIKDDLKEHLVRRETDGVTVYLFSHSEFNSVITERYLNTADEIKKVHSMIADYFLGTWHQKEKPLQGNGTKNGLNISTDRQVPAQPLTFKCNGGGIRFNKRKYDQVPRHLYLAERLKELNQLVLFNYEWMYNKIKALSLQHIMNDFALNPGVEATLVEQALHVAESVIESDINNLGPEISGHLLPYYPTMPNIRALIQQCDTDGLKNCALLPNFPYLQVPGSSLLYEIDTRAAGDFLTLYQDDRYLLVKQKENSYINVYDLAVGEKKESIFTSNGDLHITPNGKYFVIVDHVTEKSVKLHDTEDGKYLGQLIVLNHISLKPKEKYKMGSVSVTNDRICLTVTTDSSYLCIAEISTCKFLQIIGLDGRSELCQISPLGRHVFCNSNEFLLGYDLYTLEHTGTFSLGCKPNTMTFSRDGMRGYIASATETKLLVMHIHNGTVEMAYKSVLDEDLPDDTIQKIKISPNDDNILIRGLDNIIVYSRFNEKVIARFQRPTEVPRDFKLPKSHCTELFFTEANYTRDGNFVIGTIFRNIYLWQISSGNLITTIQAPVGIITKLLVSSNRSQIITHIDGASEVQVWNIDEAVNPVNMLDRLSGPINIVKVTNDGSIAYVSCEDSDEIGVIDMRSGCMLDLLTHDSPVSDFAITSDGVHVLVSTVSKKRNVNKLWDMSERRIIKEFGNSTGYCVSSNFESSLVFVAQDDVAFQTPFFINSFKFIGDAFHESRHPVTLGNILEDPFLTSDDKYLVTLIAHDSYDQNSVALETPTIGAFSMEDDAKITYYNPESFRDVIIMKAITGLRYCPESPYTIAVMYESESMAENGFPPGTRHGFLILDIYSGSVITMCQPFLTNSVAVDSSVVFTRNFAYCMDSRSNVFDLTEAYYLGQLPNPGSSPMGVALNGTVALYYKGNKLYVVRLMDGKQIAKCNVHGEICHLHVSKNDRTVIVGCNDGTIASYAVIDPDQETPSDVVKTLRSRKVSIEEDMDGRLSRSWDKVENGLSPNSRPNSPDKATSKDKILLKRVKPAPKVRPNSDTFMYLNAHSKTCVVM